ncbi:MAG: tRNA (guanosine(46)-N7)-methyltransferase TrmB [Gammaproteobacteria bacterium]|nr:MAG: tRNA (guanosine(46)-N7)-methyltransferase TrmB [Gammaproteobacteria bacterium]
MADKHLRKVRSFVRRPGRITSAQRRALTELMPRFGIEFQDWQLDLDAVFGRSGPRLLDIGFGSGEALLSLAANNPRVDYLGVEVHEPGIGHLLLLLERADLSNVRIIQRDAVEVLASMLTDACLDGINLFFPDPWPKKRHHKRRLVQPAIAREFARVIRPGGLLHIATDWEDYAEHTREIITADGAFTAVPAEKLKADPRSLRPPTKFERRGQRLGHGTWDLLYERRETEAVV